MLHGSRNPPEPTTQLLIQTMLLRGLHVDEDGRSVFDGAFIHVAGGGKGGFDYRFAMPTRHFSMLEDHIYPTDFFPFATTPARDPVTGAKGSILDRARALGAIPKLFYVNSRRLMSDIGGSSRLGPVIRPPQRPGTVSSRKCANISQAALGT
jgi:hypothetical protein